MIENRVEQVLRETFKLEEKRSLQGIGPGSIPQWDSIGHVSLIHAVEEAFEFRFTVDEIAEIESLESLKQVVRRHVS